MQNSPSSESGPDTDPTTAPQQDQDPVMPPPTSPPNEPIPSPSPPSPQHLQSSTPDQEDPPPASPQPNQETTAEPRPTEEAPDDASAAPPTATPSAPPAATAPALPPALPKEESAPIPPPPQQPQPAMQYAPRRTHRQRGRPGRPPNINENSLMRRLECVMAVESGRMNMMTACQQYDISARTFYRWLRNKDRLIELTGFTEDDFKNGNPPVTKQTLDMQDSARMPVHRQEPDNNLPRLPNQPVVSGPENRPVEQGLPEAASPSQPHSGAKRRLPKASDSPRQYTPRPDERYPANPTYYRRNFTKMPSQPQFTRDPASGPSERQAAARSTTRMRRDTWHDDQNVEYVRNDDRSYPVPYNESPPEVYKRRKVGRPAHLPPSDDTSEPLMIIPHGEPQPNDERIEDGPYVNGNAVHHDGPERVHLSAEGAPADGVIHGRTAPGNGARPRREMVRDQAIYDPRAPRKHRIEVMMGRRKVTIAWYDGTAAEDIKASIARRFALLPEAQWALMDQESDELVISDGLPSGRYTLTVLS